MALRRRRGATQATREFGVEWRVAMKPGRRRLLGLAEEAAAQGVGAGEG